MPDLNITYAPAEAERGKFAPLTNAELSSLGMTVTGSRGRYSIFTYNVGTATVPGSSTAVIQLPNTTTYHAVSVPTMSACSIYFTQPSTQIEIYNNSITGNLYLGYTSSTTFAVLTSQGMVIEPRSYYAIDYQTNGITVGTDSASHIDAKVIMHYRS